MRHEERNQDGGQAHRRKQMTIPALLLLTVLLWPSSGYAQDPAPAAIPPVAVQTAEDIPMPPDVYPSFPVQTETDDTSDAAASAPFDAAIYNEAMAGDYVISVPTASREWNVKGSADRIGYGLASAQRPSYYPDWPNLNAGWYVDWVVRKNPDRPGGMQHMQMVRLHQRLTCGEKKTADRTLCPYVVPHAYDVSPIRSVITATAIANPGAVWLLGNEMDRVDWIGGRQDEMLPEVYATAYHELYHLIKQYDPTAKVAIGGVIQFTPLREEYLNKIWDSYQAQFGTRMPVDVWNVHNFIGPEVCENNYDPDKVSDGVNGPEPAQRVCFGMAIPPGVTGEIVSRPPANGQSAGETEYGAYWGENPLVISKQVFANQIEEMRRWMKDKGEGNKPLIVTEYGVLWPSLCEPGKSTEACRQEWGSDFVNLEDPAVIHEFMLWTFDYFRTKTDCSLTEYDGCRLVQQWAWFSLDDAGWGFNPHTWLADKNTRQLTEAGRQFRDYVRLHWNDLQLPNGVLP